MNAFKALLLATTTGAAGMAAEPPAPYPPVPSPAQLAWHELELYGFVHFTVNTFTDKEWGFGDEDPAVFNPTDFDADDIARAFVEGGLRGLILTAKHHDGFCLWPSAHTEHSVKRSPWRQGRGDMVREFADACRRHGLKFGVYLSPWDRNHPEYGRPAYVHYYHAQLRELLTNYGEMFEVWFDGANGGTGYYGGARERRQIDWATYYGWGEIRRIVRELQPGEVMFNGPDVRWVGNEEGVAGDPCWATFDCDENGAFADRRRLERGDRPGRRWLPAECDVSIRPGWFYHAAEDDKVKSPDQLADLYFKSVGRGASLLLNVPPDRRGRVHERDRASLVGFRRKLEALFATNLAPSAAVSSSNTRGGDPRFAAARATDGDRRTYWATDDDVREAELVLAWDRPVRIQVVDLREPVELGQRIDRWAIAADTPAGRVDLAAGESIGWRRLWRSERPIEVARLIVQVKSSVACPALAEVGTYAAPAEE